MQRPNLWEVAVACVVAGCAAAVLAGDTPPPTTGKTTGPVFAAADFIPSPEHPVGFGGNGDFWYAGATPPFEFQDGTPVKTKAAWDVEQ